MASIDFYAGEDFTVNALSGSGLGFYGAGGFGASVAVGEWQGRTFITNSAGTVQGPECDNCKYASLTGVTIGQSGSGLTLDCIPNHQATLNVRFTHTTAVRVQNVQAYVYDRVSKTNPASGVTTALYEVSHTGTTQAPGGSGGPGTPTVSGAHAWTIFDSGEAGPMPLTSSPGTSGLRPSGSSTQDTRHDFYLAISVSPDDIGSKLFGLWIDLEYL